MQGGPAWKKVVSFWSWGMINPGDNGVILKDPITGFGNLLAHAKDNIFHDEKVGVWIGKRVLKGAPVGLAGIGYELLNLNLLHYAFRIDGNSFNLEIKG
jgi:hypothetical protein